MPPTSLITLRSSSTRILGLTCRTADSMHSCSCCEGSRMRLCAGLHHAALSCSAKQQQQPLTASTCHSCYATDQNTAGAPGRCAVLPVRVLVNALTQRALIVVLFGAALVPAWLHCNGRPLLAVQQVRATGMCWQPFARPAPTLMMNGPPQCVPSWFTKLPYSLSSCCDGKQKDCQTYRQAGRQASKQSCQAKQHVCPLVYALPAGSE